MDSLETKLQQLLQHLKIVGDESLSALASKVCTCGSDNVSSVCR